MTQPERSLRRSLNLVETTLAGIGIILGAGVYALVGAVAGEAGNGIWLSFVVAAVVAAVIGLCYAELASMFPHSAADHEYTRQALGPRPAFVVGWLVVVAQRHRGGHGGAGFRRLPRQLRRRRRDRCGDCRTGGCHGHRVHRS